MKSNLMNLKKVIMDMVKLFLKTEGNSQAGNTMFKAGEIFPQTSFLGS